MNPSNEQRALSHAQRIGEEITQTAAAIDAFHEALAADRYKAGRGPLAGGYWHEEPLGRLLEERRELLHQQLLDLNGLLVAGEDVP